jgi:hypothetical protein
MSQISPTLNNSSPQQHQLIGLNIGGTKFLTTRETLLKNGENFFSSLLAGRIPTAKDKHGNYFIDRNGKYAKRIDDELFSSSNLFNFTLSIHFMSSLFVRRVCLPSCPCLSHRR